MPAVGTTPDDFARAAHELSERATELAETNRQLQAEIVQRRAAEESLREAQGFLEISLRAANVGLWTWDLRTNQTWFSPRYLAQLGYEPGELPFTYEQWASMLQPDDRERMHGLLRRYIADPWPDYSEEFRIQHKDGSYRWILTFANIEYDSSGNPIYMRGCHLDVTEQRRLEQRVHEREVELAHMARVHMLGEMVTGLAHELNQPLATIATDAETCAAVLAERMPQIIPEIHEGLRRISDSALRAGEIIRRLRRLVRREPAAAVRTQIADTIRQAVQLVAYQSRNNGIDIHVEADPESLELTCDPVQIEQVVVNLLQNAVESVLQMPRGQRRIECVLTAPADVVEIEVRDSGPGICHDHRDRVFEAFFTTKREGLGIGLAISRTLVEAHGGHIECACPEAGGAIFRFTIPRYSVQQTPDAMHTIE